MPHGLTYEYMRDVKRIGYFICFYIAFYNIHKLVDLQDWKYFVTNVKCEKIKHTAFVSLQFLDPYIFISVRLNAFISVRLNASS